MKLKLTLFLLAISFTAFSQNALHFDGVNDYVQSSFPGPTGNSSRTVEASVKIASISSAQKVICDWGEMPIGQRFTLNIINGIPRIEVGGFGISAPTALSLNVWHHLAATYEATSNSLILYVDGVLANQGIPTVTVTTSGTNGMVIGRRNDSTNYFGGSIDEVRIWSVVRSPGEISAYKNAELCLPVNGLFTYYKFNEGTASGNNAGLTSLPDLTGNNNNGNLNGFALTGNTSNWVSGLSTFFTSTATLCKGSAYVFGSQTLTAAGQYTETFVNTQGCDSVVVLTLSLDSVNTGVFQSGNILVSQQLNGIYQWVDCTNNFAAINGQIGNSYTASASGNYAVIVTKNGCSDTSVCIAVTVSGLSQEKSENLFLLYPNPSQQSCLISSAGAKEVVLSVYNPLGVVIYRQDFKEQLLLETGHLQNGIYVVELKSDSGMQIQKLVVNH